MFDWITGLLDAAGYLGVAFLMFAENVFPPIPSELIMPLAGFLAYQDQMNFVGVVIAGSIGSLAGTYLYYIIARKIGHDRVRHLLEKHGRWLTMSPEDLDRASDWFDRHGNLALPFNTEGMYRGYATSGGEQVVEIYEYNKGAFD